MAVTPRALLVTGRFGLSSPLVGVEPAGTAQGDMLIALFRAHADSAPSVTLPALWTEIPALAGTQGVFTWKVGYILRGASAPDLDFAYTNPGNPVAIVAILAIQSGGTITFDSVSAAGASGVGAVNPDPGSTTALAASSLSVAMAWGAITSYTASTGYAALTDPTFGGAFFVETKSLSAAGAENPSALGGTPDGAFEYWHGFASTWTDAPPGTADALLVIRKA